MVADKIDDESKDKFAWMANQEGNGIEPRGTEGRMTELP
jgi:hypothetical protein